MSAEPRALSQRSVELEPLHSEGGPSRPVRELSALQQQVHTGRTAAEPPLCMEWQDLSFRIGEKEILKGVTGLVEPGRVTGLMGPSGSGKTTLLNVLSGRQRTSGRERSQGQGSQVKLEGKVSVNGREVETHEFRSRIAYVFQDNALPENETPRECLDFSAYLRLPASVSRKARCGYVDGMLKRLNLDKCSDTVVGSALQKGLSGGEQKRTAVGVELISNPKLLFLDEPLSGLDSYNAYTLMESLKQLAASGVPVFLTLHQPSSEIFALLDDVIILHGGEVCFHGSVDNLVGHFEQLGFSCPANYNPGDRVMFIIQQESPEVVRSIKSRWLESGCYQALQGRIRRAAAGGGDGNETSSGSESSEAESGEEWCSKEPAHGNKHPKGCCKTLAALMRRDLRTTKRTWVTFVQQALVGNLLVALVYGMLFFQKGQKEDACLGSDYDAGYCQRAFLVHFAVLSMISINMMYASHAWAIEILQSERSVFLRERAGGYYEVIPYFFSKTLFELPLVFMQCIVMLLGTYWLVGLRGNFLELLLEMEVLAITSSSMMYCISAGSSSRAQASGLSTVPTILQFAFSGVLLPIRDIPVIMQWMKWICPLYYGLGMLSTTEFHYLYRAKDACLAAEGGMSNATLSCPGVKMRLDTLESMDIKRDHFFWPNLGMCLILFFVLRGLAVLILWRKSRYVL